MGHTHNDIAAARLRLAAEPYRAKCEARWFKRRDDANQKMYLELVAKHRGQAAADALRKLADEL